MKEALLQEVRAAVPPRDKQFACLAAQIQSGKGSALRTQEERLPSRAPKE